MQAGWLVSCQWEVNRCRRAGWFHVSGRLWKRRGSLLHAGTITPKQTGSNLYRPSNELRI